MPIDFAAVVRYLEGDATKMEFDATFNEKEYHVVAYRVDNIVRVDLKKKEVNRQ